MRISLHGGSFGKQRVHYAMPAAYSTQANKACAAAASILHNTQYTTNPPITGRTALLQEKRTCGLRGRNESAPAPDPPDRRSKDS